MLFNVKNKIKTINVLEKIDYFYYSKNQSNKKEETKKESLKIF